MGDAAAINSVMDTITYPPASASAGATFVVSERATSNSGATCGNRAWIDSDGVNCTGSGDSGAGGCLNATRTTSPTITMGSTATRCTVTYKTSCSACLNNNVTLTQYVQVNQAIAWTSVPASKGLSDSDYNVTAVAKTTNLATATGMAITYSSVTPAICTVVNSATGLIHNVSTGTCQIRAAAAGDTNMVALAASAATQTSWPIIQSQTITPTAPASAAYNSSFNVSAIASSGLPVSVAADNVNCTGSGTSTGGSSVSILMTNGTTACKVNYSQAGNGTYAPAVTLLTTSTTAVKIGQTISVPTPAPASAAYGTSFNVAGSSTSGLAVTATGSNGCSGSGTGTVAILMISGTTACTVTYTQAGNANYNSAANVSSSTSATKIGQTITVTGAAPTVAGNGSAFTVSATASSGLGVAITTTGSCSGSGTNSATITMTSATGICTVLYNQAGNTNYSAAATVGNYVSAMAASGSGCFGEGIYTSLQFSGTGGYIGWACNNGSISCMPKWNLEPGVGFKGHVLQTRSDPGKTFRIQLAPGSSTNYNILNTTDATCIASGNATYESSGTRQGSNSSLNYLVAFKDTATLPTAYCDYTAIQTQWKINTFASYVTFETAGYPSGGCIATDGFGLSRTTALMDFGYGDWGDSWVRNLWPERCEDAHAKMTCGGYQPLPPNHVRFEFDSSTAYLCQAPTVTLKVCTNAAPALGGTDSCSPYAGYMILTPSASKGTWGGLTSAPSTGFVGSSLGITLADTVDGESTDFSYSAPLTPLADTALECYDTKTNKRVSCTAAMTYKKCEFVAVEKAASVGTHLYTKLAGTAFDFDIVGTKEYTGNLTVDLVNASSLATCDTGPAPAPLATVVFTAPSASSNTNTSAFSATGRVSYNARYDEAAPKVGVRIMDKLGNCYGTSDYFSIRPAEFTLATNTIDPSGVAVAGSSAHANGSLGGKTGMTITATAINSSATTTAAYIAKPALDPSGTIKDWSGTAISALPSPSTSPPASPAAPQTISWASGSGFNAAVAGIATGTFYYNDFGKLAFPEGSIFDNTFTAASGDSTGGDCVANSTSNVLNTGKYGCNIGSSDLISPRFKVDHYEANARFTASSCDKAGGADPAFVYMGDTALAIKLDITAMNADNVQMGRMWSDWATTVLPTLAITADSGGDAVILDATHSFALPNPSASPWKSKASTKAGGFYSAAGSTTTTSTAFTTAYVRGTPPATETAPKDTFKLTMTLTDAVDGGNISKLNGTVIAATAVVSSPTTAFRFGVLTLENAYGSELLPLSVPVRAKYWTTAGWVDNLLDSCTQLTTTGAGSNLAQTIVKGPLTLARLIPSPTTLTLAAGVGSLQFAAPGLGFNGSADIAFNLGSAANDTSCNAAHPGTTGLGAPWLRGRYCNNSAFANDPNARLNFGVSKSKFLYMREKY